jgi:hypothetical protein
VAWSSFTTGMRRRAKSCSRVVVMEESVAEGGKGVC